MSNKVWAVAGIVIALAAGAFAWRALSPEEGAERNPHIANPASVYCEHDQGGTLEIVSDATGAQTGYCHLPDGRVCEEWGLYQGHTCNGQPGAATTTDTTPTNAR